MNRFDGNNKTLNRDYFDSDRFIALEVSSFEIEFEISLDAGYRL